MIGKSIAAKAFNPFTGGMVNVYNDNTNNIASEHKILAISTFNHQIEPWMQNAFAASKFEPGKIPLVPPPPEFIN